MKYISKEILPQESELSLYHENRSCDANVAVTPESIPARASLSSSLDASLASLKDHDSTRSSPTTNEVARPAATPFMATLEPEATTILPTNEPDAFQDLNNSTTVDLSSDQLFSMLTAELDRSCSPFKHCTSARK